MSPCWKLLIFLGFQVILVKSYPFPEIVEPVSDVKRTDSELIDGDETTLELLNGQVTQQNDDMAEQNLADLLDDGNTGQMGENQEENDIAALLDDANTERRGENQEEKDIDELSEDGEREGGEYKEEENIGNTNVIEGDIYKDKTTMKILEALQSGDGRDAVTNPVRKWPGGRVPYVFGRVSSRVRSAFQQAIAEYNKHTCIRIVPRGSEKDYIYVVSEGGCWSSISRSGGRQKLSLGRGCEHKGTAIHELMHALGFFHEQSRRDRDRYITIKWNNIIPRMSYNFKMYSHGQADTLGEPYDYASIMHYPRRAFSRNGQDTIVPKKSGVRIGLRGTFSRIDIRQVNKLYKCSGVVVPTKPTGQCKDKNSSCPRWAKAGYCERYKNYMKKYCERSCKYCGGVIVPKCVDKKSACPRWARAGYCKRKYVVYMTKNCPKSCNKC